MAKTPKQSEETVVDIPEDAMTLALAHAETQFHNLEAWAALYPALKKLGGFTNAIKQAQAKLDLINTNGEAAKARYDKVIAEAGETLKARRQDILDAEVQAKGILADANAAAAVSATEAFAQVQSQIAQAKKNASTATGTAEKALSSIKEEILKANAERKALADEVEALRKQKVDLQTSLRETREKFSAVLVN